MVWIWRRKILLHCLLIMYVVIGINRRRMEQTADMHIEVEVFWNAMDVSHIALSTYIAQSTDQSN